MWVLVKPKLLKEYILSIILSIKELIKEIDSSINLDELNRVNYQLQLRGSKEYLKVFFTFKDKKIKVCSTIQPTKKNIDIARELTLLFRKNRLLNELNSIESELSEIEESKIANRKRELIKLNEYLKSKLPSDINPKNVSQFRRAFKKGDTNIIKKDKFYYVVKDFDYSYLFENSKFKKYF